MSTKYSLEQIRSTLYSGLICDVLDQMGYHHQYLGCEMDALLPDTVVFGKAFTAVATQVYSMPADPLTAQCRVLDQMQPGEVFVLTTRGDGADKAAGGLGGVIGLDQQNRGERTDARDGKRCDKQRHAIHCLRSLLLSRTDPGPQR